MRKEEKTQLIESIGNEIANYPYLYFVDIEGLNSVNTAKLRRLCYRNQVKLLVVKNTLLIKALEKSGVDYRYGAQSGCNRILLGKRLFRPSRCVGRTAG